MDLMPKIPKQALEESDPNSQFLIPRPSLADLKCIENDCTIQIWYTFFPIWGIYAKIEQGIADSSQLILLLIESISGKTLFVKLADFTTTGSNVVEARARASKRRTCALTQKRVYNRIVYLFPVRVRICRQQLLEQCHNITQHNISL